MLAHDWNVRKSGEKCIWCTQSHDRETQADSDSFTRSFLLPLFLWTPQRVVQAALHLVLMSWVLHVSVVPPSLSLQSSRLNPPATRHGPPDPKALMSQQDVPRVTALSLIMSRFFLGLPLYQLPVRAHTHKQTCVTELTIRQRIKALNSRLVK